MMRKQSKRWMSAVLAVSMALSLTACGGGGAAETSSEPVSDAPAQEESSAAEEAPAEETAAAAGLAVNTTDPITISISWWGGDTRHDATLAAIDKFMEKYPNITVESTYSAWTGWEDKMSAAFATQTAADINQINWNWITSFSSDGSAFYDLNQVSDILDLSQFSESAKNDCTVAGELQGVPVSLTGTIFFWNKTTFDQAGLETPTTLAELIEAGTVFQEKLGDDYYPLALDEYGRMILMVFYLESRYGKNWVENNELMYTQEEIEEGLAFIQSLEEAHVTPTIRDYLSDGAEALEQNSKWIDGSYAGVFTWDASSPKMRDALNEGQEFVVGVEFPDMGDYQGGFMKTSMCFAISENTEHPAECAALIDFLLNEEEGVKLMGTERGVPLSEAGLKICEENGLLDGVVVEANQKVSDFVQFSLDPKFEDASLKNKDGVYYDVFSGLSYGDYDLSEAAEILIEGITDVLEK